MAMLSIFKVGGGPDELSAIQHSYAAETSEVEAANGRVSRTVVRTDTGLMFIHVWEGELGMERSAAQVRAIANKKGMPEIEDWHAYEVVAHA
jgi:hypothetical protein